MKNSPLSRVLGALAGIVAFAASLHTAPLSGTRSAGPTGNCATLTAAIAEVQAPRGRSHQRRGDVPDRLRQSRSSAGASDFNVLNAAAAGGMARKISPRGKRLGRRYEQLLQRRRQLGEESVSLGAPPSRAATTTRAQRLSSLRLTLE